MPQYSVFQPRPASPACQAASEAFRLGQPQRAQVVAVRAVVQLDVLELEHHVQLAPRRVGEQQRPRGMVTPGISPTVSTCAVAAGEDLRVYISWRNSWLRGPQMKYWPPYP